MADLYVESRHAAPGAQYRDREEFLQRVADSVRRPGFDMVLAESASLAGYCFGYPLDRDGRWWDALIGPLPEDVERLTASGHVFTIVETVIRSHEHDNGLTSRLHQRLLANSHASLGATLTHHADPLNATLHAAGWRTLGEFRTTPGLTTLHVLILPIGTRTADDPDGLAHNAQTQRPEEANENA
jgi:hypothetical protein